MTIGTHLGELYGLPAHDFAWADDKHEDLPEPEAVAWRIGVDAYESPTGWAEAFARFTEAVDIGRVRALIVGSWKDPYEEGPEDVIAALLAHAERMPALRALFLGDIVGEECEISWIIQGDVGPLLNGLPLLEELGIRGAEHLVFPVVRHERLRSLSIQTGGLRVAVVRGVAESDFPALEHLDLWLGTSEYGGNSAIADLAPFLAGTRLPRLRHLALRNSEIQDAVAAAVASAPVVARLETLDLSMGVLTDEGAAALLAGQPLTHLTSLDLHHNYLSKPIKQRVLEALQPSGVAVEVDQGDAEEEEDEGEVWRFVAVGE